MTVLRWAGLKHKSMHLSKEQESNRTFGPCDPGGLHATEAS